VRSFSVIEEENQKVLKDILEKEGTASKIGAYYAACMDEAAIEAAGAKPIEPLLEKARKVKDKKTLMSAVIELHKHRIWALWDISAEQDFKNATQVIAYLDQNGLGLPDRDFYFGDERKPIRDFYVGHVERMMVLLGQTPEQAKQAAADVMAIETELAKVSKTQVERRDLAALYNKVNRAGLKKAAKNVEWDRTATSRSWARPA
jgi:putative endopeptidase